MDLKIKDVPYVVQGLFKYLVYMFCGFLIIVNIYYVFYGSNYYSYGEKLLQVIDYVTENVLILIVFLITSLILGFVCTLLSIPIPIKCYKKKSKKLFKGGFPVSYANYFEINDLLNRIENSHLVNNIRNRVINLHITRSIGVTSIISSTILLISFIIKLLTKQNFIFDLLISLFFFAITYGCGCKYQTLKM